MSNLKLSNRSRVFYIVADPIVEILSKEHDSVLFCVVIHKYFRVQKLYCVFLQSAHNTQWWCKLIFNGFDEVDLGFEQFNENYKEGNDKSNCQIICKDKLLWVTIATLYNEFATSFSHFDIRNNFGCWQRFLLFSVRKSDFLGSCRGTFSLMNAKNTGDLLRAFHILSKIGVNKEFFFNGFKLSYLIDDESGIDWCQQRIDLLVFLFTVYIKLPNGDNEKYYRDTGKTYHDDVVSFNVVNLPEYLSR